MGWIEKQTMDGMSYYTNTETKEVSWNKPEELMTNAEIEENKGEWVWVPHPRDMWQEARVQKHDDDGTYHVILNSGDLIQIKKGEVLQSPLTNMRKQLVPLWELKKGNLRFLEDDLVMLDPVNEAFIIRNLAQRYANKQIYTWVGAGNTVLVSVNPYKDYGIYTQEHIELHRNKPPNKVITPHVFDIANDSYDSMAFDRANQSILISGESGAGKTEATKQCLKYLAAVAGSQDSNIEEKVLVANPLLEAFGNAKTIRNINSSRFGKWMEVYFDRQTTKMQGSKIINYLLERSRVVHQQKDERNFHIFYELFTSEEFRQKYDLSVPEDFSYLSQSGCIKVDRIDDAHDFQAVLKAMELLEFTEDEQKSVIQLTAAILWLGNISFQEKQHQGSVAGSEIKSQAELAMVAKLLEIEEETVAKFLCYRTITPKGGKDRATIPLPLKEARTACDSLAMGIYGKLFNWLVGRVNDALGEAEGRFIGILDIFGFEIFENNSFEQLCINYANEKLQQLFNKTTFKEEEELYAREGVDFTPIKFTDNQPVLDIVESKPRGILPVLDDECVLPEGSDAKFMAKIDNYHGASGIFQADDKRRFENSLSFEIFHYAGVVKYDASLFMTKNVDTVFYDMYVAVSKSGNKLLQDIFKDSDQRIRSLSFKFRGQLDDLMKTLNFTESRFIRCIKPNDDLSPNKFIASLCTEQLKYSGVLEAVDIKKTGYPFRYTHRRFIYRYGCINYGYRYKSRESNAKARIKEIFRASKQDFSNCQIGQTMVLYRANEYKLLKLLRNLALEKIIPKIQAVIRGGINRRYFTVHRENKRKLQKVINQANSAHAITEVLTAVDPGKNFLPLQRRLFNYELHHTRIATTLREDLRWWNKFEEKMNTLKTKCASRPDPFFEDLKRIDQEFRDREEEEAAREEKARIDFYGQRWYIRPKMSITQRQLHKDVQELLRQCELAQLDQNLEAAITSLDRAAILAALERADELKHNTPRVEEARTWIAKFEDLDEEAKTAVKCISRSMLEAVVKKAGELKQNNEHIAAVEEMLALDEKKFVELEYERASEVGDNERRTHRELRLMEFKYDDIDHSAVNVEKLAKYRQPIKPTTLTYAAKPIANSLIVPALEQAQLNGEQVSPDEKIEIKNFKNDAKENFKDILAYTGELTDKKERNDAARDILHRGLQAYRDKNNDMLMEMYCQVIKQLSENPTNTGEARDPRAEPEDSTPYNNCLTLFAMMLSVFPACSDPYVVDTVGNPTFDDAVVVWILKNVTSEDRKRYLSALHNSKYGPILKATPDPAIVRNRFSEMVGQYSLDPEMDSGPTEGNVELYLK